MCPLDGQPLPNHLIDKTTRGGGPRRSMSHLIRARSTPSRDAAPAAGGPRWACSAMPPTEVGRCTCSACPRTAENAIRSDLRRLLEEDPLLGRPRRAAGRARVCRRSGAGSMCSDRSTRFRAGRPVSVRPPVDAPARSIPPGRPPVDAPAQSIPGSRGPAPRGSTPHATLARHRGLKVRALLTRKTYPKGVKVTKKELAGIEIQRHETCPAWNYTISPRK